MLEFKQKGRERESQLKRTHIKEHEEIKQSQRKFDHSIMSQNLKKGLSAGQYYASEDAPHTSRMSWYITQTLIQLANAAYKS